MQFDVVTLFPEMFSGVMNESILKRARASGALTLTFYPLRQFGVGRHRVTDEPPYGGGGGMVLKPEPIFAAVGAAQPDPDTPIILLSPQGRPFSQSVAAELAQHERLLLICGRYEGVDERVRLQLATDEISVGDYVLTGGELAAMVLIDAVTRLLPGVLGAEGAAERDSHATGLLEGPHYTRPDEFRGMAVPDVLKSGHAANIARWRRETALRRTWLRRPDLLLTASLTEEDRWFLYRLALESTSPASRRL